MAADQKHRWLQTALIIGTILFNMGSSHQQFKGQSKTIDKNCDKLEEHTKKIHSLELANKDIKAMSERSLSLQLEQRQMTKQNSDAITKIQIDVARAVEHIKTLEP